MTGNSKFLKQSFMFFALAALIGCNVPEKEVEKIEVPIEKPREQIVIQPKLLDKKKLVQKIQFGSCAHQRQPQPIWTPMLEQSPDLYIALGDNVYASRSEDKPISEAYRLQSQQPEFAVYRNLVPIIGTWDDHDYGQNDGGASNPEQKVAKEEFLKFFPNDREAIGKKIKGIEHSYILGTKPNTVQVILLDTRTYRDDLELSKSPKYPPGPYEPTMNRKKTILGRSQWAWLSKELRKPAKIRIIVSSIQFLAEQHGFEHWGNFPEEKRKMIKLLKSSKVKQVIFLSGDRHHSEISLRKEPGLTIYDVTASGINRGSTLANEDNRYRIGQRILEHNFGQISIDWKAKKMTLRHFDLDKKLRNNVTASF